MLAEIHPRLPTALECAAGWIGRRRIPVAVAFATALAVAAAIAGIGRIEADAPLFDAALVPAQVLEVENALTLWGESFHANAQGTQIFVAASRRRDLLLRLTIAGLPRRYIPTSADVLEDQSNALTPQSIIDDRRRSGIEGDLVAGLRRITGVADASVVLPPATADPLADPARDVAPTAAVQVVLQPGATLSSESVNGIRRFVASAYPGLAADRVTVVDASGAILGSATPLDPASAKERRVQTAVQSALDAVLGPGSAVVRVSVGTAGTEQQSQSTRVVPRGPLSSETARERGSDAGKSFDKEHVVRRFAYDTLSERRVTQAGALARISVAVFLDARRVDTAGINGIASLVRAAAGADLHAGDDVVVDAVPFAMPSPPAKHDDTGKTPAARAPLVQAALACALALLSIASLPRVGARMPPLGPAVRSRAMAKPRENTDMQQQIEATLRTLAGETPQAAAYVLASMPLDVRARVLDRCEPFRRAQIDAFLAGR